MKVLLVDDDPELRELLGDILKVKGIETVPVETGAAALTRIEAGDIEVALIDLKLEDMTGMEVLRGIKQCSPNTECILLTGYASQATAIEAINLGAYAYFQKPYDVEQLLVAVRRAAEKRAAEETLRKSESSLQAILQSTADGILAVGSENEVLYANERFAAMWRIPQAVMDSKDDAILLQHVLDQLSDPQSFLKKVQELYKSDEESFDTLYFKDGRVFERLSRPLLQGTELCGRVWSFRDVTERKLAEEALADSDSELRTLLQTSLALTDLDLETTLRTVGERASALFEADACRIFLTDEADREKLRCVLALGENQAALLGLELRFGDGVTGNVAARGQAEIVNDMQNDPRSVQIPETPEEEEAIMFAPLKSGDQVIGVMSVKRLGRERPFSPSDLELLKAFASMSASAVSNAHLFEFTRQRVGELDTLHRASQTLLSARLGPDTIYTSLHQAVAQMMPCEAFVIVLEDENGGDYHAVYLYDMDQHYPARRIPRGQGLSGKVISEGQTLFIQDYLQTETPVIRFGSPQHVRSILAVPLRKDNETVGMVSVQSYQPSIYGERHRVLLETLAAQVITVIENARLFEETRQHMAELQMLYESGLALNQLLDPKAIGQKIIELLEQKLDWHHTAIRLYHPQNESLELLAFNQPGLKDEKERRAVEEHFNALVSRLGKGMSGWAVQNSRIVRSGDVGNDPRYVDTYPSLHSGLYVPLKLGERVIGVISIESEQPNAFSEADERLVATLANQAASALENARLFEETRRRVRELETLNRASVALRAITDRDEMLAIVLEESLHALDAAHGSINLWDRGSNDLRQTIARGWLSDLAEAPVKPGEGIFGTVFASGEAHLSKEFARDPLTLEKSRGLLPPGWGGACLPIRSPEQVLGVLLISVPSERELSPDEVRLLGTLAEMTGTALHRMSLHVETARRAQEFESLYDTSQALSAENELDALIKTIVEHACTLLASESSGIYLYNETRGDLEVVIDTAHHMTIGTRLRMGEGMAGRVAQTRQPLRIENYSSWEERSLQYDGIPFRAVLEVPMLYHGELIGVLTANEVGASERIFTEADERLLTLFASQAAGAIHSARLHRETTRHLNRLQALHVVDQAIAGSLDKRVTLNILLDQVISQLGVDAADVLLLQAPLQTLLFGAGQGFHTSMNESASVRVGNSFAGRAVLERRIVRVADRKTAQEKPSFAAFWSNEGFANYYAIPLVAKGQVKGVLEVFHRAPFTAEAEWLNFLETLANHTAIALDNAQMFENLQSANMELALAYDATIEGWSRAMDLRDQETEGHTRRVTEMAVTLARAMGIHDEELLHIRRSALLHDIGKIGVPDHILLKADKLTEQEWEIMRQHPQLAYEMLQPIQYLRESLDIPYCHHEKWDGTGYPQGLKGEQIPLAARIFAIVDVFDALTSDRPYRRAWTKAKTLKHIREQSGTHFDPRVVEKFMEIFGRKKG